MKAVLKLIHSYYLKGFFGPFFVLVFPILLIFIMSNAFENIAIHNPDPNEFMRNLISGILVTTIISNGLFGLPIMIIEFKKSTMMKRVGGANISKSTFFISVLIYQTCWALFSIIWILIWTMIIVSTKSSFDISVAFSIYTFQSIPFMVLAFLTSIAIGLIIVSLFNTQQGVMGITNVIYLPISFLSGSFIPKSQIDSSPILNGISYMLPTKYSVDTFSTTFTSGFKGLNAMGWEAYTFPIIAIIFIGLMIFISVKKFKWGN